MLVPRLLTYPLSLPPSLPSPFTVSSMLLSHPPPLSTVKPLSLSSSVSTTLMFINLSCLSPKAAPSTPSSWSTSSALMLSLLRPTSTFMATTSILPLLVVWLHFYISQPYTETPPKSFKDLNALVEVPGVPPVPSWDMPKPALDRFDKAYEYFLDSSIKMAKSAGILVNSFESLDSRAIKAISNGLCIPDGPTPPIYYVGPLLASGDKRSAGGNETVPECLKWLDLQPS
ncbi:hypothetical protein I3760_05G257300 [Carya illinoinensis]|nr:hypothetical protein I3760_05G257300 [Carya illinoinensis]